MAAIVDAQTDGRTSVRDPRKAAGVLSGSWHELRVAS
jgi:hypothetical protein